MVKDCSDPLLLALHQIYCCQSWLGYFAQLLIASSRLNIRDPSQANSKGPSQSLQQGIQAYATSTVPIKVVLVVTQPCADSCSPRVSTTYCGPLEGLQFPQYVFLNSNLGCFFLTYLMYSIQHFKVFKYRTRAIITRS